MNPVDYLKKHSQESGKYRQLNERLLNEIAAIKLPFSSKSYYAFCDKYLEDDAHEALFLDEHEKYFREIATDYDTFKYLYHLGQLYKNAAVLCDIGCGIGNVVLYAAKMGFLSYGYEINRELQPIHEKLNLDIQYDNILQSDLKRLKTVDIIYIYRPINDTKLMNKLFSSIHVQAKKDVLILYNYPHVKSIKGFQTILLGEYDDIIALVKE
jgi:2-polyprenyl-3-methyl-5-hydroxy-6-metoxy-1,4-benzoquinol methylase